MARSSALRRVALVVVAVLLVLFGRTAHANVGVPYGGGELTGEPGGIADVAITHEDLAIDMRPLASNGRVAVAATYKLDNAAAEKHLDLVFASGATGLRDVRVTLDGKPSATRIDKDVEVPARWLPPGETPRIDGSGGLHFDRPEKSAPFAFRLDVPPGRHDLAVTYSADAGWQHVDDPTIVRQFAYVLAPARTWQRFGGLDLTVQVPPGWRAAVTPALKRDGDTLRATFPDLPADAVAITVQASAPLHTPVLLLGLAVLGVVTVGGAIRVSRAARKRRGSGQGMSVLAAVGIGVAWSAAFFAAGCFAIFAPDLTIPAGTESHYGYGRVLALFMLLVATVLVWAIGVAIAYLRGRAPA
jgi:hypothetical protein